MPKKGENITKRKDGRYEARFVKERDEYGRILKYGFVYAKSYSEVKIKREEKLKNLEKEKKKKIIYGEKPIEESIKIWLESKVSIKESTYTNYYSIVYSKIIPFFKKKKWNDIDDKLIIEFIRYLQDKGLGNKRIKDILLVLKQFLEYKNINIKFEFPKVPKKKIETLKQNEILIIEKNTKNSNDIKEFAILLVLYTGLRIGELCALTWKDIDLEKKVIYINKTLIRVKNKDPKYSYKTKVILDYPKTQHSIRNIPISDKILPYLKKFKKEDNCYLLTGTSNYITTKQYYSFFLDFLNSLSIKKYKFHILRHTFATRSLLCGIDIKTLSEILGHSGVEITLNVYVHVKDEEKLSEINKLNLISL